MHKAFKNLKTQDLDTHGVQALCLHTQHHFHIPRHCIHAMYFLLHFTSCSFFPFHQFLPIYLMVNEMTRSLTSNGTLRSSTQLLCIIYGTMCEVQQIGKQLIGIITRDQKQKHSRSPRYESCYWGYMLKIIHEGTWRGTKTLNIWLVHPGQLKWKALEISPR